MTNTSPSVNITTRLKMIDLFKVYMSKKAPEAVSEVLLSGYVGQGPKIEEFEGMLRKHFEKDYLLTVNSCTSALQLAVHLLKTNKNWGPNDEILVTPLTCFATIAAILANDVKVRWADVNPNNCNIDLEDVARKVGPNTRAVMVVHWGGMPVDMDRLYEIQQEYKKLYGKNLYIIEDCAHCWRSYCDGQLVGTSGNLCCFSFQAIKFLNTGDGGLLITPPDFYKEAKLLRWFGLDRDAGASFRCCQDIKKPGFKYHATDIDAAIGMCNMREVDQMVKIHKDNYKFYQESLQDVPGVILMENREGFETSAWLCTIKVENRPNFVKKMTEKGIAVSPVHARCDKHSCMESCQSILPGMDYLEKTMIAIPVGWWVTEKDRQYIVDCIKEGW